MREPFLDGLEMIVWVDRKPFIAHVTEHTFGVEFAHVGVLRKQVVTFLQCVNILTISEVANE